MSDPLVSVGLPVYNGQNYVAEAIESVLSQTYRNFELIINDNASTDATEAICRRYVAEDDRVRYFRSDHNLGAAANFNATVDHAQGTYFKWIAHDDVCGPAFLERCVPVLDADASVVVAYPTPRDIDEEGRLLDVIDVGLEFDEDDPVERFRRSYEEDQSFLSFFGLIRIDVLRKTSRHGSFPYADRMLVSELALWGRVLQVPEELLFRRLHPGRYVEAQKTYEDQYAWHDTSRAGTVGFPRWRYYRELAGAAHRAPLSAAERTRCYGLVAKWAGAIAPGLARDLLHPARVRLRRLSQRERS